MPGPCLAGTFSVREAALSPCKRNVIWIALEGEVEGYPDEGPRTKGDKRRGKVKTLTGVYGAFLYGYTPEPTPQLF